MMAVVGAIMGCQEGNFRVSPEGTGPQHGATDLVPQWPTYPCSCSRSAPCFGSELFPTSH